MKTKQTLDNAKATWRGVKKFYKVSVGVIEAFAWLGLLATSYAIIYRTLKGEMSLNDVLFYLVCMSAVVISFRLVYEGAKYFRDLGNDYEN